MRTTLHPVDGTHGKFRTSNDIPQADDGWDEFPEDEDTELLPCPSEEFLQRAGDGRYLGQDMTVNGRRQDIMEQSDLAQDFLEQWANDIARDASERRVPRH